MPELNNETIALCRATQVIFADVYVYHMAHVLLGRLLQIKHHL